MSILDQALSQFGGTDLAAIADKVGLTPQQVESAVAALGRSMQDPEDTATLAATRTGLPPDAVAQVLQHLGGEETLGRITGALSQGGGIGGVLSGLFSRG
jgi:hypothetical protein